MVDVGLWNFQLGSLKMTYTIANPAKVINVAVLQPRIDLYW
jgi:hypothetical protein